MINAIGERRPCTDITNIQVDYTNKDHLICQKINNKHSMFMELARKEATKSTMQHQHGCVIVSRNKVVSSAHNIVCKDLNKEFSIHAEVNALRKLKRINTSNNNNSNRTYEMYVVRIGSYDLKYSKPCPNCKNAILAHGISKVYYSLN